MAKFEIGDRVRVLVDDADGADVNKGDTFVVKEVEPEGCKGGLSVEGDKEWWFSFENIEPVEEPKKDEIAPKTETQPMVVNVNINSGAELNHITIGGKRFRLVPED